MKRFILMIALAALAAAPLMAADAAPAPMACCSGAGVERTVANVDNGVKVTMTAKDPKTVAMIQEMAADPSKAKACCQDCPMTAEGVTRSVEKTETGVVVTATATNPELVKKLQAHAAKMAAGDGAKGCCKGHGGEKASGHGAKCPYMKDGAAKS